MRYIFYTNLFKKLLIIIIIINVHQCISHYCIDKIIYFKCYKYLYQNTCLFLILGTLKDLETFKKKNAELSEKLTERIRQNQKLQLLYEALKRKCISPSYFEKQTNKERSRSPSFMSTASGKNILIYKYTNNIYMHDFDVCSTGKCDIKSNILY